MSLTQIFKTQHYLRINPFNNHPIILLWENNYQSHSQEIIAFKLSNCKKCLRSNNNKNFNFSKSSSNSLSKVKNCNKSMNILLKDWKRSKKTLYKKKFNKKNNSIKSSKKLSIKSMLMSLLMSLIKSSNWLKNWKEKKWLLFYKENLNFLWKRFCKLIKILSKFLNFQNETNQRPNKIYLLNFYLTAMKSKTWIFKVQDYSNF